MEDAHILQEVMFAEEPIHHNRGEQGIAADENVARQSCGSSENDTLVRSRSVDPSSSPSDVSNYARGSAIKRAKRDSDGDGNSSSTSSSSSSSDGEDDEDGDQDRAEKCEDKWKDDEMPVVNCNDQYRRIELPHHSLFAVFDGHGGSFAAEYAGLNFVRVLSRQTAFIEYAHFVKDMEHRNALERSCTLGGMKGSDDGYNGNSAMEDCVDQDLNNNMSPQEVATLYRKGLELLEVALKDAFLDIDREIWRAMRGLGNKDSILPRKKKNENAADADDQENSFDENKQEGHLKFDHEDGQNDDHDDDYAWQQTDSGTTAIVVMLTPMWIICANAGDSRSVYSKQGNCTIPLSYDHKPDDEAEERRIYEAGGFVRGGRVEGDLAVSRGFGDFRFKKEELYEAMDSDPVHFSSYNEVKNFCKKKGLVGSASVVSPEDQKVTPMPDIVVQSRDKEHDEFIILACDGIFDVQTNHECVALAADIFHQGESDLGLVCEEILDVCLEKGSKDNMTALLVKFPSQKIGEGSGVAERRRLRKEAKEKHEEDA